MTASLSKTESFRPLGCRAGTGDGRFRGEPRTDARFASILRTERTCAVFSADRGATFPTRRGLKRVRSSNKPQGIASSNQAPRYGPRYRRY